MAKELRITIRLDGESLKMVEDYAETHYCSLSQAVRSLVYQQSKRDETAKRKGKEAVHATRPA